MEKETQLGVTAGSPGTRVGEDCKKKIRCWKMRLNARGSLGGEQRTHCGSGFARQLVALVTAQDMVNQGKEQGICTEGVKLVWVSDMGKTHRQAMLCFGDVPHPRLY